MFSKYLQRLTSIAILFLAIVITPILAEESDNSYTIAINKTSFPYHFIDVENQPNGMMVDIWKLWAKKQGVAVKFIPLNWQQTVTQVQKGLVDIHSGLSKNNVRSETLDFSSTFFHQEKHLFLHRSIAHLKSVNQLVPYTVGVVAGSSHETSIKTRYPNLNIRTFANRHDLYRAAIAHEILVFAGVERLSKNFSDYAVLNQKFPAFSRVAYNASEYGAAVAKDSKVLLDFVQQGLNKISAAEKSAIERKWLGLDKSDNLIALSYSNNQAPFSDTSESGHAQGFLIELWQLWAKFNGLEVEFMIDDSAELNLVNEEVADIHIANMNQHVSAKGVALGPVIYSFDYSLFVSSEFENIGHISALENKRIGTLYNPIFVRDIEQNILNANVVFFKDQNELIKAAENGDVDVIAGLQQVIEHRLARSNLQTKFIYFKGYKYTRPTHAILNDAHPELSPLIKDGFNEIPREALAALEKKWLLDKPASFFKRQFSVLKLTEQESSWLQQHNTITFGITKNWIPLESLSKHGEFNGINPDMFELIAQRLNTKINYIAYDNFDLLYQALLSGKVDAIGSVMITEPRKKQVLFTESYWSMPWVILHPKELGSKLSLDDFKGKTLAIIKGYYLASVIRKKFPSITLMLVDDNEEGLLAVQKAVVDGFIDNLPAGTELLKKESLISIGMSVLDEVDKNGNHIAVNKNLPILANILKKAVLTISEKDSQKIYEKWFDINIETGLDKKVVMRVAVQIGVLIFIVLMIVVVWNRRLYREIKNRKRLEQQMKYMATHDDLTGLTNRVLLKDRLNTAITFHQRQELALAVLFIDLDGFKNINDNYGHDIGDELLIEVARRLCACVRESDTVVRFGGDEFVLLLTGLHNQDEAAYVAQKVLKAIKQPIELSSSIIASIGCSVGIAMYPDDGESENDLLKIADSLMYQVKASGKNNYAFNRKKS